MFDGIQSCFHSFLITHECKQRKYIHFNVVNPVKSSLDSSESFRTGINGTKNDAKSEKPLNFFHLDQCTICYQVGCNHSINGGSWPRSIRIDPTISHLIADNYIKFLLGLQFGYRKLGIIWILMGNRHARVNSQSLLKSQGIIESGNLLRIPIKTCTFFCDFHM